MQLLFIWSLDPTPLQGITYIFIKSSKKTQPFVMRFSGNKVKLTKSNKDLKFITYILTQYTWFISVENPF